MPRYLSNIFNPLSPDVHRYFFPGVLEVENGKIISVSEYRHNIRYDEDLTEYLLVPAFVDTHTHLSQFHIRSKAGFTLLDWLSNFVFGEEARFSSREYAGDIAREFFHEALSCGVTSIALYVTVHNSAVEEVFNVASSLPVRGHIAKVWMDRNAPAGLLEPPDASYRSSHKLFRRYNNTDKRLFFSVALRFPITSTEEGMKLAARFQNETGTLLQLHIAESRDEVDRVKELFPNLSYTELYQRMGLLSNRTVLAHAIHLADDELGILKSSGAYISHCPAANLFLHSGQFPLDRIKERGIPISLGSDIGAGPYILPLALMRDMYYINPTTPSEMFYYATLGGAKALGFGDVVGNFTPGKDADFVLLSPYVLSHNIDTTLSSLIFEGERSSVRSVYFRGRKIEFPLIS